MVLVTGSKRLWAISMAVSLIIFAVLYFTVIRPDNNTANQAVKSGLQQSQQVINQAQKQLKDAGPSNAATRKGTKELNKAAQLTSCVASAGTDTSKIQACQAKFG
jgi:flagellar biosynthesis/type III secretory pathway M-ring protein FliF/YscJ